MRYRLLILALIGLFLSACGSDEAATSDAAAPEPTKPTIAGGTNF